MDITRRTALGGLAAAAATGATGARAGVAGLRGDAAGKGLLYGCAVSSATLKTDQGFASLVASQAGILAPEWELKRNVVQPADGVWNFAGGDAIADFAERNGQKFRGHTLVWYFGAPEWLERRLAQNPDEKLLTDMISASCAQYRGRMHSWDVVNEVVAPEEGHPDGLRINSPWYRAFGDGYLATAFHAAREADPDALLFYGDYSVEMVGPQQEAKRVAVLKLVEKLKKQGAPIDAFGVQGHLNPFKDRFDEAVYARFLDELRGFGLKLMVTELDVADRWGPTDVARRDALVGEATRRFLDVSLANSAMLGVITWGITDRYSWLSAFPDYKWPDGQLSRGLPYDGALNPKPMRDAIQAAFAAR